MSQTAADIVDKLLEQDSLGAEDAIAAVHAEEPEAFRGQRIAPARQGSVSQPDFYPDVEDIRQLNWEAIQRRSSDSIVQLVYASFPTNTKFIRVHESENRAYEPAFYGAWGFIARDNIDVGLTIFTNRPEAWESNLGSIPQTLTVVDRRLKDEEAASPTPESEEIEEVPKPVKESEATPDEKSLLVYADEDDENTFDVFL